MRRMALRAYTNVQPPGAAGMHEAGESAMRGWLARHLRKRPVRSAALALLIVACCWWGASQLSGWADWAVFSGRLRSVERTGDSGRARVVTLAFPYRGQERSVSVRVDEAYLASARALPTAQVFGSSGRLQDAHVATLVQTESEGRFVGDLAQELRRLRTDLGLDPDEYVELLARAVQSVPYGTPDWQIRLPATLLEDGRGICTDKSVLLAALLLHEGYDTGIWVFDTQHHAAVAVRGSSPGFAGTPYSFIETTREAYVNEYDVDLLARGTYIAAPRLIQLGGTSLYTAACESLYVADELRRSRRSSEALAPYRSYAERAEDPWRMSYAALADEHELVTRRAEWIRANSDDRAMVFDALTDTGGTR